MLDRETRNRLADYFTGTELVEYLEGSKTIHVDDVVEAFELELEDCLEDLYELMGLDRDDD